MLCASDVQIVNSGNIQAKNTTIMPAIPGIIPLIYLIFSPNYAIRRLYPEDRSSATGSSAASGDYVRMTGGLFGLGPLPVGGRGNRNNKTDDESIYAKHDVEIT